MQKLLVRLTGQWLLPVLIASFALTTASTVVRITEGRVQYEVNKRRGASSEEESEKPDVSVSVTDDELECGMAAGRRWQPT